MSILDLSRKKELKMLCLKKIVKENKEIIQEKLEKIQESRSLRSLVLACMCLGRYIVCCIIKKELERRNEKRCKWPSCKSCGAKLESKGSYTRTILTLAGEVSFKRKIGRCKNGCKESNLCLLDKSLGIVAHQKASNELREIACILAIFIPYNSCSRIIKTICGLEVPTKTLYNWCRYFGSIAYNRCLWELHCLERGLLGTQENMSQELLALPLVIGGDGVMIPTRPYGGSPKGKTVWREVKVGMFARIKQLAKNNGSKVSRIVHKRLVAVLGDIDTFQKYMELEAHKQHAKTAKTVAWISDAGRGFWGLFESFFSSFAIGILDFYHAAQYLWRFAKVYLDGRTKKAQDWFSNARGFLKEGCVVSIALSIEKDKHPPHSEAAKAYKNLNAYLLRHMPHIDYEHFKSLDLPIGSGMVESACKWLIQQRFKGVGMRWSEDGFNDLLHLRLAWVNQRFEYLFS